MLLIQKLESVQMFMHGTKEPTISLFGDALFGFLVHQIGMLPQTCFLSHFMGVNAKAFFMSPLLFSVTCDGRNWTGEVLNSLAYDM